MSTETKLDPTLKALDESIAHWERMAECDPATLPRDKFGAVNFVECERRGIDIPLDSDCALCAHFSSPNVLAFGCFTDEDELCPVARKSGHSNCANTPYAAARDVWSTTDPDRASLMQAEVNFLRAVREAYLAGTLPE